MILPLKRYAQFEGRANRREYWMYQLFLFLVATAVMLLAGVLAVAPARAGELADALASMSEAVVAYRGMTAVRDRLCAELVAVPHG